MSIGGITADRRLTRESVPSRLVWFVRDVLVLTRRSLVHVVRNPAQLADVTIQPIMFVVLFTYVFGSAIRLPGGGNYHEYLVAGIFGISMAGTAPGVAVGIATDIQSGIIDRFRSLPMSRAAVLVGRLTADLLTAALGLIVVAAVGLLVGWRVHTGPAEVLTGFALALLFAYAMSWAGAAAGMWLHNPESAQAMAFVVFFPMIFVSNAFVALQNMPVWLRVVANVIPLVPSLPVAGSSLAIPTPRPRSMCGRSSTRSWRPRSGRWRSS